MAHFDRRISSYKLGYGLNFLSLVLINPNRKGRVLLCLIYAFSKRFLDWERKILEICLPLLCERDTSLSSGVFKGWRRKAIPLPNTKISNAKIYNSTPEAHQN